MSDINSLIANYLQSNSTADMSDVVERITNLKNSMDWNNVTLFNYGDDEVASEEEFLTFMANATGKDSDEIASDVSLLFDILNSESDDDVLTSDELELFNSSKDGGVSFFGTWNQLSTISESEIQAEINEASQTSSSDDDLQTTGTTTDTDDTSTSSLSDSEIEYIAQKIADGEDSLSAYYGNVSSDDYAAIQAKVEDLQSSDNDTAVDDSTDDDSDTSDVDDDTTSDDTTTTTTTDTSTVEGMKAWIQENVLKYDYYTCPEDIIAELEASGTYDADFIEELRNSYITYSDDEEDAISAKLGVLQLIDSEATRADAIKALQDEGVIGDPLTDSSTVLTKTSEYTLDEVKEDIYNSIIGSDTDEIICPEDIITKMEAEGTYDADFIEELRNSYITYSDTDEEKINAKLIELQLLDPDATREDAIEELTNNSEIGDPITDSSTPLTSASTYTISKETAEYDAKVLYNAMKGIGTDKESVDQLFNMDTLTSADWVLIMSEYSAVSDGTTLVSDIDGDFSKSERTEYYEKIVDNLLTEIDAGNEDAVTVLCQQIYGATAGQTGTADEFLEILFEKIGDDALAEVAEKYEEATDTKNGLESDIKKDYQRFGVFGGVNSTGKEYILRIREAINEYGVDDE